MSGVARPRRRMNRAAIGVFGIVVIAIGVFFVFTKRIPFVHGYRLNADFASSNQLVAGFSPVRIAGVTVGKVRSVEDGPGNLTRVQMELDDAALPIHEDAQVRIRPRLFLEGGFYVELSTGSPSAPVLDDESVLPVEQTATPVQLHQILATFDQDTLSELQTLVKELDIGLDNGGADGLGRATVAFGPVLRDSALIAEAARGTRPHDVSEGIAATSKLTSALASREQDLRGLLTSLNVTTTAFASRDEQLAESIVQIDGLISETPSALAALDRVRPVFSRTIAAVRPALRAAPPVLDDAIVTLGQLRAITAPDELPGLLDALEPTLRDFPQTTARLDTLFGFVRPVMNCLRERAVPVLNSEVPDGELSTGAPVWLDLAQAGVGVVGFAQNFDGNGFSSRYTNGAGEQSIATGEVPGLGQLVGTVAQPIIGQRPTYLGPGLLPPNRPDAPCMRQPLVDLSQRTDGGLPAQTRAARTPTAAERETAETLWQELKDEHAEVTR